MSISMLPLKQTNRPIDALWHWTRGRDSERLLLDAPYQRGDVWGPRRRVNLIWSILRGIPIPSLIINDRLFADWPDDQRIAVIDGKQRITSVLRFIRSELAVPAPWFDGSRRQTITFANLSQAQRRKFLNIPLAFSEGRLASLSEEQEVFNLVNFGGLLPGEVDEDCESSPREAT